MKFKCPKCGKILSRDMRQRMHQASLTKTGNYKTYCENAEVMVYARPIK